MPPPSKKKKKSQEKASKDSSGDLIDAFKSKEMSTLDFTVWKPQEEGTVLWGQITKFDVSKKFQTPFLVVTTIGNEEFTIYLKSALLNVFIAEEWLASASEWIENINDGVGQLIAFQYLGKILNENTGRHFEGYKVLFEQEIPESFVDRWNQEVSAK